MKKESIGFLCNLAGLIALIFAISTNALAQTGVSDDRVSLPEGPGSIDGFSDNAQVSENMGMMSYEVAVKVPSGHPSVTPELQFAYSSGTGATVLGMGWDMPLPAIERMTSKGLPVYGPGDMFAVSGSAQLVELPATSPAEYRLRREGAFVRYRWHDKGDGKEGYWTSEQPDGTVGYYGADADGVLVESARFGKPGVGTFRYYLHETVDVFGHRLRYSYAPSGNVTSAVEARPAPLLREIGYVFDSADIPLYTVNFAYENRPDLISDAKAGYNEVLGERMSVVTVKAGGVQLLRYLLQYEDEATSGGVSRLASISMRGTYDGIHPVRFDFEYSKSLGNLCLGSDCEGPYLVSMGSLGVNLAAGNATLIDINGDALPDVVDTTSTTGHRFFLNEMAMDGSQSFGAVVDSALGSSHQLSSPYVQVLDVDGDGFTDMINSQTQQVLRNNGSGDWAESVALFASAADGDLPDFGEDFGGGDEELAHIRFIDYDNDKRIDVIRSLTDATTVYQNNGSNGFRNDPLVGNIGAGFASDALQLSDMNGDGLLDPVQLFDGGIRYRLNLGWGQWSEWIAVDGLLLSAAEIPFTELEDLNGDDLSDIVIVQGSTLRYAINRNGASFDEWETVTSAAGGAIPERTSDGTVLFADMNGNGSSDAVWIDASGKVTFLELFPVRPHLLSKIANNLGMVTEISYGSSVEHMARAVEPWTFRIPHAMNVVNRMDTYDSLSQVHEVREFVYRNGHYDGEEKQFRGFANTESMLEGDESQEDGLTLHTYDVGDTDAYFAGLLRSEAVFSADREISEMSIAYADCDVAGLPKGVTLSYPVRFVCQTAIQQLQKEGADPSQWVTTLAEKEYDGYGNVILSTLHGVTQVGGGACESCGPTVTGPCGPQCLGDEQITETTFVPPANRTGGWLLRAPYREVTYGSAGASVAAEELSYYDGAPFEGLALGQIEKGLISRVVSRRTVLGDTVISARNAYDAHGNLIESIDPNGTVTESGHRRKWVYDTSGLHILQSIIETGEQTLTQTYTYNALWGDVIQTTDWAATGSTGAVTEYAYDEFGRLTALAKPGDTLIAPTMTISHAYGSPVSAITVLRRSMRGGGLDLETVQCVDGLGRTVQQRTRVADGEYLVDGFIRYNKSGAQVEAFQPYTGSTAACDLVPPEGVLSGRYRYDALYRLIGNTEPDATIYGTASAAAIEYGPLYKKIFDFEDNELGSAGYLTPIVEHYDGLERLVAIERTHTTGNPARISIAYDFLGNIVSYTDPAGNMRTQQTDLLGQVLEVNDPNKGITTFEYDAAGNTVKIVDGNGRTAVSTYDGVNRLRSTFDPADEAGTRVERYYDQNAQCDFCTNGTGQLTRIEYPTPGLAEKGFDDFSYDDRQNMVAFRRTLDGKGYTTTYTYDNISRRTGTTHPDATQVGYTYDGASRVTSVAGVVESIGYDSRGLQTQMTFANGVVQKTGYDAVARVNSHSVLQGATVLQGYEMARSRVGNITQVTDSAPVIAQRPTLNARYEYDEWYRALHAILSENETGEETISYGFDDIDNIVRRASSLQSNSPAHVGEYVYGGIHPNAATQAGTISLEYDPSGQMIRRGEMTLNWDYQGRLTGVQKNGELAGTFIYGDDQSRVGKLENGGVVLYITPEFEVRDGVGTAYATVGTTKVARLQSTGFQKEVLPDVAPLSTPDGQITAGDAWLMHAGEMGIVTGGPYDAGKVSRLLRASARRMLVEATGETVFLHGDHVGNLSLATNGAGEQIGERLFYMDGEIRYENGYVDEYGFTGQERDESSGLTHFDYRYLDTGIGRWASVDPAFGVMETDSISRLGEATAAYAYVANNYINNIDDTGMGLWGAVKSIWAKAASWEGTVAIGIGNIALGTGRILLGDPGGAVNIVTGVVGLRSGNTEYAVVKAGLRDSTRTKVFKWVQRIATVAGIAASIAAAVGTMGIAPAIILSGIGIVAALAKTSARKDTYNAHQRQLANHRITRQRAIRPGMQRSALRRPPLTRQGHILPGSIAGRAGGGAPAASAASSTHGGSPSRPAMAAGGSK